MLEPVCQKKAESPPGLGPNGSTPSGKIPQDGNWTKFMPQNPVSRVKGKNNPVLARPEGGGADLTSVMARLRAPRG
jgi:hypothetical protein